MEGVTAQSDNNLDGANCRKKQHRSRRHEQAPSMIYEENKENARKSKSDIEMASQCKKAHITVQNEPHIYKHHTS